MLTIHTYAVFINANTNYNNSSRVYITVFDGVKAPKDIPDFVSYKGELLKSVFISEWFITIKAFEDRGYTLEWIEDNLVGENYLFVSVNEIAAKEIAACLANTHHFDINNAEHRIQMSRVLCGNSTFGDDE